MNKRNTFIFLLIFSIPLARITDIVLQGVNSFVITNRHYETYKLHNLNHHLSHRYHRHRAEHYYTDADIGQDHMYSDNSKVYDAFRYASKKGKVEVGTGLLGFKVIMKDPKTNQLNVMG